MQHKTYCSRHVREAWNDVTAMTIKNNFNMADLITEIDNNMTEDLDIFINTDNDDSDEDIQAILRDIEQDLVFEENSTLEDPSVEENLENEDELQETINSFPGWDVVHHSFCDFQNKLYHSYAAKIAGDKYEEMIDAFEQFNKIFRKVNRE